MFHIEMQGLGGNGGYMNKHSQLYALAIIGILFVPGCKRPIHKQPYLRPLTSYIDYHTIKQGITLRVKQLSAQDCKPLLGERAHRLFKKHRRRRPVIPLQLSITNDTHNLAALDPKNIDLPLADPRAIATRLQRNSFIQAFGGIAAGLVVTTVLALGSVFALSASGILLVIIGSMKALAPLALLGGSALLVTPFFLIIGTPVVSTIKGVQTTKNNQLIKREIKDHSLKHALIIEPHQTIDTLIFVEKSQFQQQFTITIANPEKAQEKISFHVTLPKKSNE